LAGALNDAFFISEEAWSDFLFTGSTQLRPLDAAPSRKEFDERTTIEPIHDWIESVLSELTNDEPPAPPPIST